MKNIRKLGLFVCGMLILASLNGFKVVAAEKPENISLSKSSVKVTEGKNITVKASGKATIQVSFSPEKSSKKISLSTDKKDIVLVTKISDYYYKVKGLKVGKATITVKSVDNPALTKTLTVTVKKKGKKLSKKVEKKGYGIRKLTGKNFVKEIEEKEGRAAIMFGTTWCGYCRLLDPIYKNVAEKDGNIRYYHVDGDEERYGLVELFGVQGFPAIYLVENKRTIDVGGYYKDWMADDYIKWANEKKE